jgi:uncharacterized protein (TIGR02117 family)
MRRAISALTWLIAATWLAACAAAAPLPAAKPEARAQSVRVVSNGWHTAIVIGRAEAVATGLLPEAGDFPTAAFLEFGWGDRTYYPASEPTLGMALAAALTPTPAIMHMAGLARPPDGSDAESEVEQVAVSQEEFLSLIAAIAGDFVRPEGGRAAPVSRGLYPDSNFYDARGTFYLFNTCNTWTARMLRAGGVNISPAGVVTASELMTRLRAALESRGAD